jgi:CheY-like chemotaxis protein
LDSLVASVDRDLRTVQIIAATQACAGSVDIRQLLSSDLMRRAAGATSARQLSISARAQHAAACRLLAHLPPASDERPRQTEAVLVVDDHGEIRQLVARILETAGFTVRTAANGLEGLIAAYEMRPDVIVMDVSMPVLDGIEATRLIKASAVTRDARVIAYTGDPQIHSTPIEGLFAAVLQKPAPAAAVLAAVQQVAGL